MHSMKPLPDGQASAGTLPAPLLVIDWGVEPQAGRHLSPEFHLVAPGFHARPQVTAVLDGHLDQDAWKTTPWLSERGESHWCFHQTLELTRGGQVCPSGQFLLQLQVVFSFPHPWRFQCYRAVVRITVPDAAEAASPILEIRANESSLVNLQGLDINRYAKIVVEGGGSGVVNVLHGDGASSGEPPRAAALPNERLIVQLPLETYPELQRLIPQCGVRRSAPPMDAATLLFDDGRRIHLLARDCVSLGRDGSGNKSSDIMLRLLPLDDDRWTLSRLISRQHVRLALSAEGLRIEDEGAGSTFGTWLDGRRLTAPHTIAPPESWWPLRQTVVVAGVLGLDVSLHHDRGWDEWAPFLEAGETYYAAAAGCRIPPRWQLARASRIDAVRVCRRVQLPLADYLEQIKAVLMPGFSQQWDSVSRAAAAIASSDALAEREQYVLVYRTATVGSTDEAAIKLDDAGRAGTAARLLSLDGGFWLESLDADQPICVDGRPLDRRELMPLVPGTRLRLGGTELTFDEFQQFRE